ncbi:hypothetical protein KDL44_03410 [bacterium]|nr:hypothetical protein [bacterium]
MRLHTSLACLLTAILASACTGGQLGIRVESVNEPGALLPQTLPQEDGTGIPAGLGLPSPLELAALNPPDRLASSSHLEATAYFDDVDTELPNRNASIDELNHFLRMNSDWINTGQAADMAYATFLLDLSELPQLPCASMGWQKVPQRQDLLYLGLGNFDSNRWDWYSPQQPEFVELPGLEQYAGPAGQAYMLVLYLGDDQPGLGSVGLGVPWKASEVYKFAADPPQAKHSYDAALVNGNPAVVYVEPGDVPGKFDVKYSRGLNVFGDDWGFPVVLTSIDDMGTVSMAEVNGKPAVAFQDPQQDGEGHGTGKLKYIRSIDANGSVWDDTEIIDSLEDSGHDPVLKVVNGNPAILFGLEISFIGGFRSAQFVRANDADGTDWPDPISLASVGANGNADALTPLTVIDGNPATLIRNFEGDKLYYIRAMDPDGAEWNFANLVDGAMGQGTQQYLIEYNGLPAVTYDGSGGDNTLFSAATSTSGETWSVPQSISQTFLGVDGGARPQGMYVYEGVPQVAIQQWRFHRNVLVHGADGGTASWSKPEQISCYDLLDIHSPVLELGASRHMLYVSGNRLLLSRDTLH